MNAFSDSEILNTVVRMVVPMKREFGRQLDVAQFMRDQGYARSVLDEALGSSDARLRDYAAYLQTRMAGARNAAPPLTRANGSKAADAAPAPPADPAHPSKEDEMRARVLRKYTGGLR